MAYHVASHSVNHVLKTLKSIILDPSSPSKHSNTRVLVLGISNKHRFGDLTLRGALSTKHATNDVFDDSTTIISDLDHKLGSRILGLNGIIGRDIAGCCAREQVHETTEASCRTSDSGCGGTSSADDAESCTEDAVHVEGCFGGAAGDIEACSDVGDVVDHEGHLVSVACIELVEVVKRVLNRLEHVVKSAKTNVVEVTYAID